MYSNVGGKMKTIAVVCAGIVIAASVIYGIILMVHGSLGFGLLYAVGGSFFGWLSGMSTYALGQVAEDVGDIKYTLERLQAANSTVTSETVHSDASYWGKGSSPSLRTWTCSCGANNSYALDRCQACKKKRPMA